MHFWFVVRADGAPVQWEVLHRVDVTVHPIQPGLNLFPGLQVLASDGPMVFVDPAC